MKLEQWIKQAKELEEGGKKLSQISLETYLEEQLNLRVIETTEIDGSYQEEYRITTTNGEYEYVFYAEYYDSEPFSAEENVLILEEIRGKGGVFKTRQQFWVKNNNKNHKLFTSSLEELISGKKNDKELAFVLDYLKKSLEHMSGYEYKEKKENDIHSFVISLADKVDIYQGFSNTIQISFKKQNFSEINFIFRERTEDKIKREVDDIVHFLAHYCAWNVHLDGGSISDLYEFLKAEKLHPMVQTDTLLVTSRTKSHLLFYPMVVGEYDTYHQVKIKIYYYKDTNEFVIVSNYLLREFAEICKNTQEVKEKVKNIIELIR